MHFVVNIRHMSDIMDSIFCVIYYNSNMDSKVVMFTNEYKKIGLNILRARRIKRLSQEELAAKSGVSRSRISGLERGKDVCKLNTLMLLAQALDMDYQEFFKDIYSCE